MTSLVQIAIPSPLHRLFDYRWSGPGELLPGVRVQVPFGRRTVVGVVVGSITHSDVPAGKLRSVTRRLDDTPLLPGDLLSLLQWASRYYHHPLGEVLASALPVHLRKGAAAELPVLERFRPEASAAAALDTLSRAPRQQALLTWLLAEDAGQGLDAASLGRWGERWRQPMQGLLDKGLVGVQRLDAVPHNTASGSAPPLLPEQQQAVQAVDDARGRFQPFLLEGVTGSGKTEVYLRCIEAALAAGQQVLILVPEISLTPQLMRRFADRLDGCLVSLHSALNDSERLHGWLLAARGDADVVVGTRSAVLVPMPRLGLVIVDEEHDPSLKQQDGFRYHGRDLALMRARDRQCPVLLGSATPSFESLNNTASGRYQRLPLTRRAGDAVAPNIALLDIRRRPLVEGLSDRLLSAIETHLDAGGQALVFLNRRGFAPTLLCNDCGAAADCARCDAHMTVHARLNCLRCHHCGAERAIPVCCEQCGSASLDRVGYGTERIAAALAEAFPDVAIARIDRDSTRRKGSLQAQLEAATRGDARLLVGTQMLAKGHHFPGVTLVGVLDADRGLFGTDFRSLESMGQLVIQVAGRAGRESRQGTVLIQTRNPDNALLQTLVRDGYPAFADVALAERRLAHLPPYAFMALLRAEAAGAATALQFLDTIADWLRQPALAKVSVLGPAPAPMERLGGRYRAQLLLQADQRSVLNHALTQLTRWLDELPEARRTRWSIDVDPVDFF